MEEHQIINDILRTAPTWNEMLISHGPIGLLCFFLLIAIYFLIKWMVKKDKEYQQTTEKFTEAMKLHAVNEAAQTEVLRDLKKILIQKLV